MKTITNIIITLIVALSLQSCTSWRLSTGTSYPYSNLPQIGQRVKALWGNSWWDAVIVDVSNNQYYIHYEGYGNSYDSWVTIDKIQYTPMNASTGGQIGQRIRALWGSKWYDAVILDSRNNQFYIHYEGESSSYDEWVTPDRVQFSNFNSNSTSTYYVGQLVKVEQRGIWYDATIVQVGNNQYYIKYTNYNESEWVPINRIRLR